jgi:hypothetical protein
MTVFWMRRVWLSAALWAAGMASAAAPPPSANQTIPDLLRALSATGVDVLYSSDLVPPQLEVGGALYSTDLLSRVVEALALHGLTLRSTPSGRFIVVRTSEAAKPGSADAADASNAATTKLAEVSVFASRYAITEPTHGEPYPVPGSDVAHAPGAADDAMRALRSTPGLASNISSQPYVRGAFLDDVLVQFDGVSLADPFHFRNYQSVISAFDPNAIDHMNVYTGGFPVEYGSRSAGVIDLTPRSLASGAEYQVGASRETAEMSTVGAAERLPIEWLFALRHSTDGAMLRPIAATIGSPTFYDVVGRVRWQANDASAWTLGLLLQNDQARVGGEPSEEASQAQVKDLNAWLAWDWVPEGSLHGRTSVTVNNERQDRSGTLNLPGVAFGRLFDDNVVTGVTLRSDWLELRSESTTVNFGAELGRHTAELNYFQDERYSAFSVSTFGTPTSLTVNSHQTPESLTQGLYASVRWHWRRIEAEVGARLDREDYRDYGSQVQATPRFNLRYDPAESWHVYGSWGQFTQAQRPDEWRVEENQTAPDPASRATHLIGGVAYDAADAIKLRLEAYRNHWSWVSRYYENSLNSVSLVPELAPDRLLIAPTDAETQGLELSARRQIGRKFNVWATYAWSKTTDDVHGHDVPRSWNQKNAATLGAAWRHRQISASLVLDWHSGWPQTPLSLVSASSNGAAVYSVGARNSSNWGNYFTADARVSRTFETSHGDLDLWVDATNLTNRANDCCTHFDITEQSAIYPLVQDLHWRPREFNFGFSWRVRRK